MLEKMKAILAEQLDVDEESITTETRFKEDLEADSLDLFEMIMSIEEEYGMEFPAEDLENLKTVGDVLAYLQSKGIEG